MQNLFSKLSLIVIVVAIFASCNKDLGGNPTLEFFTDSKYIWENDSVAPADTVLIGLKCSWNGKDPLESIYIQQNGNYIDTIEIPSNDSEGVGFSLKLGKTAADVDSFVFELVDVEFQSASLTLVLYKDTSKSDLREVKGIELGAQNSLAKQLYAVSSSSLHDTAQVDTVTSLQKKIDFVGAFDSENKMYIGAPAANFNGIYDFDLWEETDTTHFVAHIYTTDELDLLNKAKIKEEYDAAGKEGQSDKATNLAPGDMYVFRTQANKYGVIIIKNVTSGAEGSIVFDMKVQK